MICIASTNPGKKHNPQVIGNNHEQDLFFIRLYTATHYSQRIVHFIESF